LTHSKCKGLFAQAINARLPSAVTGLPARRRNLVDREEPGDSGSSLATQGKGGEEKLVSMCAQLFSGAGLFHPMLGLSQDHPGPVLIGLGLILIQASARSMAGLLRGHRSASAASNMAHLAKGESDSKAPPP
jgi:hypothetical protein